MLTMFINNLFKITRINSSHIDINDILLMEIAIFSQKKKRKVILLYIFENIFENKRR